MHKNSEAKQPKETDEIKKKLESYAALHRRIDNQIERLENLEAVMGSISSPSFDGISGGGGDGTSKQERQVIQKVTLEETIRRMIADEDQERSELEKKDPLQLRRTRDAPVLGQNIWEHDPNRNTGQCSPRVHTERNQNKITNHYRQGKTQGGIFIPKIRKEGRT